MVLFQSLIAMIAMLTIASMAIDVGIYYTARSELDRAADAAALAAAATLSDGQSINSATDQAISLAQDNAVCGSQLPSNAITVETGTWANSTFTPSNGASPNAVRVKLQCSSSSGNPISLFFSRIIGIATIDIYSKSVAKVRTPVPDFNLVGINNASFGSIGLLAQIQGRFVGNGDVSIGMPLGLFVSVQGDARSYGGQIRKGPLAAISGSQALLDQQLVYPSVELPPTNNNDRIAAYLDSNGDFNAIAVAVIPAGTYVVRDLNLLAGLSVNLLGPVTFYVQRNFNMAVAVNLLGSGTFSAENFKVRVMSGGYVFFLASILIPLNMDLYAPDSDIIVAVGLNYFKGRMIGKTLTFALPLPGVVVEERGLSDPFAGFSKATLVN